AEFGIDLFQIGAERHPVLPGIARLLTIAHRYVQTRVHAEWTRTRQRYGIVAAGRSGADGAGRNRPVIPAAGLDGRIAPLPLVEHFDAAEIADALVRQHDRHGQEDFLDLGAGFAEGRQV